MRNNHRNIILIISLAIVSMLFYLFFNLGNRWEFALYYRGIKLAAILVVSCSVAYSTVAFQTLTTNRILTPSIMGFEAVFMLLQTLLVFVYAADS
ncbi:MAG: iron chelate uptake ABC transporter family permease subunit, partial [Bacteroidales bacterium]|nr:iron chelate uptake ABC transporter family permease subunit [Bacteroidales bacterium]